MQNNWRCRCNQCPHWLTQRPCKRTSHQDEKIITISCLFLLVLLPLAFPELLLSQPFVVLLPPCNKNAGNPIVKFWRSTLVQVGCFRSEIKPWNTRVKLVAEKLSILLVLSRNRSIGACLAFCAATCIIVTGYEEYDLRFSPAPPDRSSSYPAELQSLFTL